MNPRPTPESIAASAQRVRASGRAPTVAVVLGSGWDGIAETVDAPLDIAYAELPAFPALGVAGHAGTLRLGRLGDAEVALLRGRQHAYESGDAAAMMGAIRTLAAIGCATVVLTNAAGSLDPAMRPGSLMLIADHLNIAQRTPLHGEPGNDRFVDLRDAYDPALRQRANDAATALGLTLHEGTYAWVLGPQFETPAEIRMLRLLGAQAVGMSTVPETILARHAGLKVLGLSMLTNMGCGMEAEALSHAHTLQVAQGARQAAARLLRALVPALAP
jgi:purine-nucleoside phosphorylase